MYIPAILPLHSAAISSTPSLLSYIDYTYRLLSQSRKCVGTKVEARWLVFLGGGLLLQTFCVVRVWRDHLMIIPMAVRILNILLGPNWLTLTSCTSCIYPVSILLCNCAGNHCYSCLLSVYPGMIFRHAAFISSWFYHLCAFRRNVEWLLACTRRKEGHQFLFPESIAEFWTQFKTVSLQSRES